MDIAIHQKRRQELEQLYEKAFPSIARLIKNMGGNYEDAKDIFHDAMVLLYERGIAQPNSSIEHPTAYLRQTARNLWLKSQEQGEKKKAYQLLAFPKQDDSVPIKEQLLSYLELAGKRCLDLLESFYYHQYSMAEITKHFGFRNVRSATVQKYKCLEKIRDKVQESKESITDKKQASYA
ncbi:MAG: RNA polymerase sigma factor [Bacteroidota bacterium]